MENKKIILADSDLEMVAGGDDWICTREGKDITFSRTVIGKNGMPEIEEMSFCGEYASMMAGEYMKQHPHDTFKTSEGKPFRV